VYRSSGVDACPIRQLWEQCNGSGDSSLWKPGFALRSVYVGLVVGKIDTLTVLFPRVLQFSPVSTISYILQFSSAVPFHQYSIHTPVFPHQYHSINTPYILQLSPVSTIPSILHTYSSFPPSVPFHQYSIPFITYAV
jgi:hypothetical protein